MRVETSRRRIVTVLLVATQALSATAGGADEAQHATLESKAEQQRLARGTAVGHGEVPRRHCPGSR